MEQPIRDEEQHERHSQVTDEQITNQFEPLQDQRQYIPNMPSGKKDYGQSTGEKGYSFAKRIKRSAWIFAAVMVAGIFMYVQSSTSKSVDTSAEATEAIETRISTTLAAGTRILSEDDNYIGGDLTITHDSNNDETELYIWDYAAEDGDYVEVFVDGVSQGKPFMIKNKAVSFTVPTVAEVQIVGTRDGGGGITYAVHYTMNNTTYFNGMDEGGDNVYTLIRETAENAE